MQTRKRKRMVSLALPLILGLAVGMTGCSSSSSDLAQAPVTEAPETEAPETEAPETEAPEAENPVRVPLAAAYAGEQTCKMCHSDVHAEWATSWHTKKTTWGPNVQPVSGQAKFLPGVIAMWAEINSHMILDRATLTDADRAAGVTNKNYVTKKKFDWREVDIVVGETRKQRYAAYYDGNPVAEAHYSYSTDGGINWTVDTAVTVSYPGNRERAGYKFFTVEMNALTNPVAQKGSMYGEFYSWQERCIGCHTTGFDPEAWNEAKAAYVATGEGHLRDIHAVDIRISCEACHGPALKHIEHKIWGTGRDTIINPAKLSLADPTRKMVCEQCHTRTGGNLLYPGAPNDNRGFVLGQDDFMDVMRYTRPAWGTGNRQVAIDGKGRRDHQQDMDIRLTQYTAGSGGAVFHGLLACFDCHDSHNVGNATVAEGVTYSTALADKTLFTTGQDPTGLVRLNQNRTAVCGQCHSEPETYLAVMNGVTGWDAAPADDRWNSYRGRGDRKQHVFNFVDITNSDLRALGLKPEQYTWGRLSNGTWEAIWPWEATLDRYTATHKGETPPIN